MTTKIRQILIGIIILLLVLQGVSAIGITPARININFEPGLRQQVNFSVLNSEGKDMSVTFSVRGALSEYITLSQEFADFSSSEKEKSFSYWVELPESFDSPGKYEGEIVALEVSKDVKEAGTFVGASLAVITQCYVHVPYPDEYLETEFKIVSSEQGNNILFLIPIINRGKKDILDVSAVIDIYSPSGEKVGSVESSSGFLKKLERKEISSSWVADVSPGIYTANVTISYNGNEIFLGKNFEVGEMLLEIKEILVKDFELGEIAKFDMLVQNKWAHEVNDTYVRVLVYDSQGGVIAEFKTPNQDFQPLQEIRLPAYWDTAGVSEGLYDGKLVLHYGEKKKAERNIQLRVSDYDLEVIGLTGKVVVREKGMLNLTNILIALVILLVLSNIIWFFVLKRRKKK